MLAKLVTGFLEHHSIEQAIKNQSSHSVLNYWQHKYLPHHHRHLIIII